MTKPSCRGADVDLLLLEVRRTMRNDGNWRMASGALCRCCVCCPLRCGEISKADEAICRWKGLVRTLRVGVVIRCTSTGQHVPSSHVNDGISDSRNESHNFSVATNGDGARSTGRWWPGLEVCVPTVCGMDTHTHTDRHTDAYTHTAWSRSLNRAR